MHSVYYGSLSQKNQSEMLETWDAMFLDYMAKVIEMNTSGIFLTRVSFRAFIIKLEEV